MNYSIFVLKILSVYVCEYVSHCIYREKGLKSTQSISIFFWGLGLGSSIGFFSFLLLHALQNCLNLLLRDVYNLKKKKKRKQKEEICQKILDGRSGSLSFVNNKSPLLVTHLANSILWFLPNPKPFG